MTRYSLPRRALPIAAVVAFALLVLLLPRLGEYGPDLLSQVAGLLITLAVVKRVIREEREGERRRIARIAAPRIHAPLSRLVAMFGEMVRAATPARPSAPPADLRELFSEENLARLRMLDFTSESGAWPEAPWWTEAPRQLRESHQAISAALDRYAVHLPTAYVEALDALPESPLTHLLGQAGRFKKSGSDMRLFGRESYAGDLRRYVRLLMTAVEEHNALSDRPIGVPTEWWSPTSSPPFGSGL